MKFELVDPTNCPHPRESLVYLCEWPEMCPDAPSLHNCGVCGTSLQFPEPANGQAPISFDQYQRDRAAKPASEAA